MSRNYSSKGLFGKTNHYSNGHKTGFSRGTDIFGNTKHYGAKGGYGGYSTKTILGHTKYYNANGSTRIRYNK